jgi:oligoendopeptidase F
MDGAGAAAGLGPQRAAEPTEPPKTVDWAEAEATVMGAYAAFAPEMADRRAVLSKGWIDAGVKPGKAPGAFAHPTVTTVHPYVMLNYLGKPRDVMTLAHELGHGVHQVLAAGQGELLSSTPLTLAETAIGLWRDADLPQASGPRRRPRPRRRPCWRARSRT